MGFWESGILGILDLGQARFLGNGILGSGILGNWGFEKEVFLEYEIWEVWIWGNCHFGKSWIYVH